MSCPGGWNLDKKTTTTRRITDGDSGYAAGELDLSLVGQLESRILGSSARSVVVGFLLQQHQSVTADDMEKTKYVSPPPRAKKNENLFLSMKIVTD